MRRRAQASRRAARLPIEAFDLPLLLDRPDELRSRLPRGFRDALVPAFEARELKFEDRPSAARD